MPVDRRTSRVFLIALVAQVGIVVTGGLVRLTGSGLGCPSWPQCVPGSYTPMQHQAEGAHRYVEFGNRTLTFVVSAAVLAALVAAWRYRRDRPTLWRLALLQLVGVAAQAVLGGVTVWTGLHPAIVAGHFLLSMALVAAAVALYERGKEGDAPPVPVAPREVRWLGRGALGLAAVVLTVGTIVTGSGPHAGDEREVARFDVDPRLVSWLHADLVLLFVGLVVGIVVALRATGAPARARERAVQLLVVTLAQGAVGYTQYFTGLPIVAVAAHMLGACLVWVAALRMVFGQRERAPLAPAATQPHSPARATVTTAG